MANLALLYQFGEGLERFLDGDALITDLQNDLFAYVDGGGGPIFHLVPR